MTAFCQYRQKLSPHCPSVAFRLSHSTWFDIGFFIVDIIITFIKAYRLIYYSIVITLDEDVLFVSTLHSGIAYYSWIRNLMLLLDDSEVVAYFVRQNSVLYYP